MENKKITAEDYRKLCRLLEEVSADFDTLEAYNEETTEEDKQKLAYGCYLYFALHENGYFYEAESKTEDMPEEVHEKALETL